MEYFYDSHLPGKDTIVRTNPYESISMGETFANMCNQSSLASVDTKQTCFDVIHCESIADSDEEYADLELSSKFAMLLILAILHV